MFEVRDNEPDYALLNDSSSKAKNRYDVPIDTVTNSDELYGKSLNINGDCAVGENPNRYKQHGFFFTADNCIGCHACEAACSEKNDNPAHIAFRSVGFVEGGTYPDYQRLNISMACNHCDDPVCLKGCPTRAYTKFAEYGAVLQDPDICFGCGYCTWVCPYNAPQLDPVKGQVTKCNMCVDRLEVGLKPACVSACLGNALDFGVIENIPEGRTQARTEIPGFPDTDITRPNIRFQQTRTLQRDMVRVDSTALKYHRDDNDDNFKPVVDPKYGYKTEWNISKLRSREDPLVLFTLISQMVVGAFLLLFIGPMIGLEQLSPSAHSTTYTALLFGLLGVETYALFISTMHLGKPQYFYRAFYNLRYSPVSREVASLAIFYNLLALYTLVLAFPFVLIDWLGFSVDAVTIFAAAVGWAAVVTGPISLFFMHSIYRIKARPFWNHWQVLTSFFGNMLALGGLLVGFVYSCVLVVQGHETAALINVVAWSMLSGLLIEAYGLWRHAVDMKRQGGEGAASHYIQQTKFGKTYKARNLGLVIGIVMAGGLFVSLPSAEISMLIISILTIVMLLTALVGRALFYVLVTPTTMPGAFFWHNKGFEEHAREVGLADMPQVGVVPDRH